MVCVKATTFINYTVQEGVAAYVTKLYSAKTTWDRITLHTLRVQVFMHLWHLCTYTKGILKVGLNIKESSWADISCCTCLLHSQ